MSGQRMSGKARRKGKLVNYLQKSVFINAHQLSLHISAVLSVPLDPASTGA